MSVSALKKAIKAENPATITCDAKDLKVYLAKTADRAWLSSRSEDVKKLKKGEKTDLIEALTEEDQELQAEDSLEDVLEENHMPTPQSRQIHVLVLVPKEDDDVVLIEPPSTIPNVSSDGL
ncbi:unnamed protein product [Phytophthora lilii]|uniref:Unnamed protein product n=1 Tax=Phytophthora lilii TaxID=2077276 RepID=A0A9W6YHR5_9STRA|nr:unnamed protein product [Phytophthora lilii]